MEAKIQSCLILALVLVSATCVAGMSVKEEHFTVYIHSSAQNMSNHLNKDVLIENDHLVVKSARNIGDVSVYSAFNIHAIDKGTHKISIGTRTNGLIEVLLCTK